MYGIFSGCACLFHRFVGEVFCGSLVFFWGGIRVLSLFFFFFFSCVCCIFFFVPRQRMHAWQSLCVSPRGWVVITLWCAGGCRHHTGDKRAPPPRTNVTETTADFPGKRGQCVHGNISARPFSPKKVTFYLRWMDVPPAPPPPPDKTIAILRDRWRSQATKQEGDNMSKTFLFYILETT